MIKSKMIGIRLTAIEFLMLSEYAEINKTTISDLVREQLQNLITPAIK